MSVENQQHTPVVFAAWFIHDLTGASAQTTPRLMLIKRERERGAGTEGHRERQRERERERERRIYPRPGSLKGKRSIGGFRKFCEDKLAQLSSL